MAALLLGIAIALRSFPLLLVPAFVVAMVYVRLVCPAAKEPACDFAIDNAAQDNDRRLNGVPALVKAGTDPAIAES